MKKTVLIAATLFLALSAHAQTLSGTVTNGTTNKPAAGDEVVLINLTNGMEVAASTKVDSAGKFTFALKDAPGGPHLIRAIHQGVTYHQIAPPGTSSVEVKVYDVAKKVSALSLTADVLRFQADSTSLQGMRLFAVDNNSTPPVTQLNEHNFEFYLPAGAKLLQVQARAPNGQPIGTEAEPQTEKGRYAINFPLRPGETQFQLEFTVPYTGTLKIDPKPLYPAEHFVVMLPKSMHFSAADAATFKSMQDPNQSDAVVELAQQTHVGQSLAFTVSGTGTVVEQQAQGEEGGSAGPEGQGGGMPGGTPGAAGQGSAGQGASGPMNENPQTESSRPGGGLGVPIDAPDPLEKYRWPIIGTFIVLLGIGGWIVTKRQGAVSAASGASARATLGSGPLGSPITGPGAAAISGSAGATAARPGTSGAANAPASKSAMLLEALKEELFQLEVERNQGKITPEDYDKAKAALDQTLDRALKR
ncbi:MAG: hypothetical protein WCA58_18635, partial [Terriglobales bacterium]